MQDYASQFAEAFIPSPWRVFGVPLGPFTLGHSILLERISSPFAVGGSASVDDTALAVIFCSFNRQSWLLFWRPNDYQSGLRSLYRRTLKQRLWTKLLKAFAWYNADAIFAGQATLAQYIREARTARPACFITKEKTRESFAPDALTTLSTLLRLGYSEQEALNMPYAKANWLYYGWLTSEGAAEFPNPAHGSLMERVAAAQRKACNGGE